jgi:NAD(P)-dependent dehydrogenase (short-subunit alcohol dehydrogenase family)
MTEPVAALVTGATRGIGRAVAAELGRLGLTVLIGARDPARGEEVARELGGEAVHLDVTDPDSIAKAAAWIGEHHGRLDVLVNNAGISGDDHQAPGDVDPNTIRGVFATNVLGAIAVTEAMLPLLRRSPAGRIVNLSSSVGSLGRMSDPDGPFSRLPATLAYAPSKAALNQVTVQYAKALATDGILVNAADPGGCATDFTATRFPGITRTAADGARIAVWLATLPADGPTGAYLADAGPVPW